MRALNKQATYRQNISLPKQAYTCSPHSISMRTNGYVIDDLVHCYRSRTRQTLSVVFLMATSWGRFIGFLLPFPEITGNNDTD